jgi:hypothetical protein
MPVLNELFKPSCILWYGPSWFMPPFREAMKLEIATMENIDAWTIVEQNNSNEKPHHVIPSTWAFKCKRYPNGLIKKFKARFCARGNK